MVQPTHHLCAHHFGSPIWSLASNTALRRHSASLPNLPWSGGAIIGPVSGPGHRASAICRVPLYFFGSSRGTQSRWKVCNLKIFEPPNRRIIIVLRGGLTRGSCALTPNSNRTRRPGREHHFSPPPLFEVMSLDNDLQNDACTYGRTALPTWDSKSQSKMLSTHLYFILWVRTLCCLPSILRVFFSRSRSIFGYSYVIHTTQTWHCFESQNSGKFHVTAATNLCNWAESTA